MPENTPAFVLIEITPEGRCQYLFNADDQLLVFMHASLGAYINHKLAPTSTAQVPTKPTLVNP